jgi:hypothetical protein
MKLALGFDLKDEMSTLAKKSITFWKFTRNFFQVHHSRNLISYQPPDQMPFVHMECWVTLVDKDHDK